MAGRGEVMERSVNNMDLTGQTIDRYVIVALIGTGTQGRVYRGRDAFLNRHVAIKIVNDNDGSKTCAREDLIAEARALSRVSHPNVANLHDWVSKNQCDFLVMEFIAGATLEEVIAGGPLPASEVVRLGSQLMRGLAAIHAANVAHGDIKPANLKITSCGELKIVDFGIAKRLPASLTGDTGPVSIVAGTLPYMAPELWRGQPADERSDIFSAGAVLYEMATGCRAFPQHTVPALIQAIQECEVIAPSRANPALPPALDSVVLRALSAASASRYGEATEVAEALESLTASRDNRARRSRTLPKWCQPVVTPLRPMARSLSVPAACPR